MKANDFTNVIFAVIALIMFAFRIYLGRIVGISFSPNTYYDDAMMIRYANLHDHFIAQTLPYNDQLFKDMGFPVFLNIVRLSGIQYVDWQSLLWCLSAILFLLMFVSLTGNRNKIILLALYAYILFTPITFSVIGVHLYRNSILTPFYFIVLTMMATLFVWYWGNIKIRIRALLAFNVMLGLIFTLTCYIKEDGLWLLMCLATVLVLCIIKVLISNTADTHTQLTHVALLLIPLIIFEIGTVTYKLANYKYFGVYLVNNRTEGELGRFMKNIYNIQSDSRSGTVWAPTDALLKAFKASPTLTANPQLTDAILHTGWFGGDLNKNAIKGDFLGWVMLSTLRESGTCHSLVEQEEFLAQVNDELEHAFENGTLPTDDRIHLVSSMGGRTFSEILGLQKIMWRAYWVHVMMGRYKPAAEARLAKYAKRAQDENAEQKIKYKALVEEASKYTNINLFAENKDFKLANTLSWILFKIYAAVNTLLFMLAFAGIYCTIKNVVNRKYKLSAQERLIMAVAIGSIALSFVYILAIAWFSEFLGYLGLAFYCVGMIPMTVTFGVTGTYMFYRVKGKHFFSRRM